jgi:hypothetical protein
MNEIQIWQEFTRLALSLSPENLGCDGELSMSEVNKRLASIKKQWKDLETKLGRPVTEDEVFKRMF